MIPKGRIPKPKLKERSYIKGRSGKLYDSFDYSKKGLKNQIRLREALQELKTDPTKWEKLQRNPYIKQSDIENYKRLAIEMGWVKKGGVIKGKSLRRSRNK